MRRRLAEVHDGGIEAHVAVGEDAVEDAGGNYIVAASAAYASRGGIDHDELVGADYCGGNVVGRYGYAPAGRRRGGANSFIMSIRAATSRNAVGSSSSMSGVCWAGAGAMRCFPRRSPSLSVPKISAGKCSMPVVGHGYARRFLYPRRSNVLKIQGISVTAQSDGRAR